MKNSSALQETHEDVRTLSDAELNELAGPLLERLFRHGHLTGRVEADVLGTVIAMPAREQDVSEPPDLADPVVPATIGHLAVSLTPKVLEVVEVLPHVPAKTRPPRPRKNRPESVGLGASVEPAQTQPPTAPLSAPGQEATAPTTSELSEKTATEEETDHLEQALAAASDYLESEGLNGKKRAKALESLRAGLRGLGAIECGQVTEMYEEKLTLNRQKIDAKSIVSAEQEPQTVGPIAPDALTEPPAAPLSAHSQEATEPNVSEPSSDVLPNPEPDRTSDEIDPLELALTAHRHYLAETGLKGREIDEASLSLRAELQTVKPEECQQVADMYRENIERLRLKRHTSSTIPTVPATEEPPQVQQIAITEADIPVRPEAPVVRAATNPLRIDEEANPPIEEEVDPMPEALTPTTAEPGEPPDATTAGEEETAEDVGLPLEVPVESGKPGDVGDKETTDSSSAEVKPTEPEPIKTNKHGDGGKAGTKKTQKKRGSPPEPAQQQKPASTESRQVQQLRIDLLFGLQSFMGLLVKNKVICAKHARENHQPPIFPTTLSRERLEALYNKGLINEEMLSAGNIGVLARVTLALLRNPETKTILKTYPIEIALQAIREAVNEYLVEGLGYEAQ